MKKFVKVLVPLLIILVSVAVFAYMKATKPVTKQIKAGEKSWAVNAWTVNKQDLRPQLSLYGIVESPFTTTVSAVLSADVSTLAVLEGQKVKAGQTLIVLDPKDISLVVKQRRADLNSAKSSLRSSQRDLSRQEALFKKKIIAPASIDKARQNVATLKANFSAAEARLAQILNDKSRAKVTAPFAGRITQVYVSPGDRVNMGSKLVSLYDSTHLEVRAQLPNTILAKVRDLWDNGQEIKATIGTQKTPATLSRITGEVKANAAGVDAIFGIDKEDKALSLGRSVALRLLLPSEKNLMFIPYEALYNLDKIYLIDEGRLERLQVQRIGQYEVKGTPYVLINAEMIPEHSVIMVTQLSNAITGLKVNIATLDGIKVSKTATQDVVSNTDVKESN